MSSIKSGWLVEVTPKVKPTVAFLEVPRALKSVHVSFMLNLAKAFVTWVDQIG